MTRIRLEGISKHYGSAASPVRAVDASDLEIATGEFFFLLGPSGCGKTTLLRTIAGLIEPTDGKIWFDDRDVTELPCEKRNTAMVFQSYALWPHMSVRQNVEFGPKMKGAPRSERTSRATQSLELVEMGPFALRKPNQLSGGQQQRVAVARALAAEGDCLLLDEPLSNLDAKLRLHMRSELRRLVKAAGATAIYVTHDQKEALSMADRVAVMNEGRIIQVGSPRELYNFPAETFVAGFLGEANFLAGKVVSGSNPLEVDTPAGRLVASNAQADGDGDGVTCCVRPERVEILAPGAGGEGARLGATVEAVVYQGETCQYLCRLGDGSSWKVLSLAGPTEAFGAGDGVELGIGADDVVLLTR